jgi:hypothetical protein
MAAAHVFELDFEAGRATLYPPSRYTKGYPRLAFLMGSWPDFAIFRRFGWLSTLNLMRLQAELAQLESDLQGSQIADEENQKDLVKGSTYSTNFNVLAQATDSRQRKLMEASMLELQEYSKHRFLVPIYTLTELFTNALLLQSTRVTALSKPRHEKLMALENWLKHCQGGDNFQRGIELLGIWDREYQQHHLVVLHQPPADDE